MFKCTQCAADVFSFPRHIRCTRCGAVYVEGERISPDMIPIDAGPRQSPWMLPHTRPVVPGMYDCWFGELRMRLYWDGIVFRHGTKRVRMHGFTSWRGCWA